MGATGGQGNVGDQGLVGNQGVTGEVGAPGADAVAVTGAIVSFSILPVLSIF